MGTAAAGEFPRDSAVAQKLRVAHCVCFDVDSTLLTVEGIDELADLAGVKDDVEKLTSGGVLVCGALCERERVRRMFGCAGLLLQESVISLTSGSYATFHVKYLSSFTVWICLTVCICPYVSVFLYLCVHVSAAMDGGMTFHTSLRKRLEIIKPSIHVCERESETKNLQIFCTHNYVYVLLRAMSACICAFF